MHVPTKHILRSREPPKVTWTSYDKVLLERAGEYEEQVIQRSMGVELDLFVPTGLAAWDANGGVSRGVLTVLGGVDGQGKSIVKKHLGQAAARSERSVAQVDFEDPKARTADREFSTLTGIDSRKLGLATFDPRDLDRVMAAAKELKTWAHRIQYHGGLVDSDAIMDSLYELADSPEGPPDLVLLDYAQALPSDGDQGLERKIAKLAWDANVYAQRTNCAFVVFSQVKPEVANRGNAAFWAAKKRDPDAWDVSGFCPGPGTQDLAWSSAFGQRARAVGYIFRPGDYERKMGKPGALDNRLVIRWAKVNFGNSGVMEVGFDGPTARLFDL